MRRLLPETLERYVERARPILIEVARQRTVITYNELINKLGGGPGRGYVGEVIGQITEIEQQAGRPKLCAVVVRGDTKMVSGGFFWFPDTPEAIRRSTPEEFQNPRLSVADQEYWQGQLQEVYHYWQGH
jgi:hypothetical protein